MEVKISHLERSKFSVQARGHSIVSDQPLDNNGDDAGMTPPEFLLASLGACAAYYAMQYLMTRKLAETGVEVTVTAEKLKQPGRLGNFKVNVQAPVALTEEQIQGLMRSIHVCTVHNTLTSVPAIDINLELPGGRVVHGAEAASHS